MRYPNKSAMHVGLLYNCSTYNSGPARRV